MFLNALRCKQVLCSPCRERPTSPSTEEAIQGMLSMAGLLCSSKPEKVASPQKPWWSSPGQCSPLEQREAAQHQHRLQGDKSPMDSQGNSSEAWDNQGLPSPLNRSHGSSPETDYQYCDPSMSPPLHPSKRHAPNPPPISNQATKGLQIILTSYCEETADECFHAHQLKRESFSNVMRKNIYTFIECGFRGS